MYKKMNYIIDGIVWNAAITIAIITLRNFTCLRDCSCQSPFPDILLLGMFIFNGLLFCVLAEEKQ